MTSRDNEASNADNSPAAPGAAAPLFLWVGVGMHGRSPTLTLPCVPIEVAAEACTDPAMSLAITRWGRAARPGDYLVVPNVGAVIAAGAETRLKRITSWELSSV